MKDFDLQNQRSAVAAQPDSGNKWEFTVSNLVYFAYMVIAVVLNSAPVFQDYNIVSKEQGWRVHKQVGLSPTNNSEYENKILVH